MISLCVKCFMDNSSDRDIGTYSRVWSQRKINCFSCGDIQYDFDIFFIDDKDHRVKSIMVKKLDLLLKNSFRNY